MVSTKACHALNGGSTPPHLVFFLVESAWKMKEESGNRYFAFLYVLSCLLTVVLIALRLLNVMVFEWIVIWTPAIFANTLAILYLLVSILVMMIQDRKKQD